MPYFFLEVFFFDDFFFAGIQIHLPSGWIVL